MKEIANKPVRVYPSTHKKIKKHAKGRTIAEFLKEVVDSIYKN